MRAIRPIALLVAAALVLFGLSARSSVAGGDETFKVIVNPENKADSVSRDFVRDAYLRKATEWKGETVRPIDLSSKSPARERFTHDVIRKTSAQLKAYWNQQIFSGKGVPPPEVESVADVIAYVLAHKGAVGYIPVDADPGKARVIKVQ